MTSWTPGPWHLVCKNEHLEVRAPENIICDVWGLGHGTFVRLDEAASNALLIAAAPDLYEALDTMLDMVLFQSIDKTEAEEIARAALSKAKGEA